MQASWISDRTLNVVLIWGIVATAGCQTHSQQTTALEGLSQVEQRVVAQSLEQPAEADAGETSVLPTGVGQEADPQIYEKLKLQIPDPIDEQRRLQAKLSELSRDHKDHKFFTNIQRYVSTIDRDQEIQLSLSEVIHRTLANSHAVRVQSYNPAIRAADIVEAEAVFDALFFASANITEANTPTPSALTASDSSRRNFEAGLLKLLPSGMTVQADWKIVRQEVGASFAFAFLNPAYTDTFSVTLSQPLLRNFGLDVNRSRINIAKLNRRTSEHAFRRAVQDQLLDAERAYWQLVVARRRVVINARLIAELQRTHDYLVARREFDVSLVEITQAKASLYAQIAQFVRIKNEVKDAEDQLKNLINDPELNLADEIEIIPTEFPMADPMILDRLVELQSALDHREELQEAELAVESAKIGVGVAKNQALPKFDARFTYSYEGLGKSQHEAFGDLSDLDFHTYNINLIFEWPLGNRGLRAASRRARLQHAQTLAQLKQTIEEIILRVNLAVRELLTSYEQIAANLSSAESQVAQVQAIEARAESKSPEQLTTELNARRGLANSRENLLNALIRYNFAIAELERAKGTLLEYNNVSVVGAE